MQSLNRFGRGFTLHVKIGSPEDFIGAVSEHVLARGRSSFHRQGSKRTISVSSPTQSFAPSSPLAVSASENFHNFIKENFESSILLEEHQVNLLAVLSVRHTFFMNFTHPTYL